MTWARTRTRASSNNVIHLKQESMGIGANASARIDREHSLNLSAVDKAVAELRLEVAVRDKRRKELEFLEKGGNPLDFEYSDGALTSPVSVTDLILSESEAKERKLFLLQNKGFSNGIVAEIRKGFASRDSSAEQSKLGRNGESCELTKQVLRRGTLPSIVRVREEKSSSSQPELRLENGASSLETKPASSQAPKLAENGEVEKPENSSPQPELEPEQQESSPEIKQEIDRDSEKSSEVKNPGATPVAEFLVASEEKPLETVEKHETSSEKPASTRSEDDILGAAKLIQATRQFASRKPASEPARRKSHWDFILEEMAWMANDFMQERLWKSSAAALVCRSASQATFWSKAEKKLTEEVKTRNNPVNEAEATTSVPTDKITSEKISPLENYAYSFLTSTPSFSVPRTPDVQEPVQAKRLHFIVPSGATEAFKLSVERSWSSKRAIGENDSEPDDDSFFPDKAITVKREFEPGFKKKRRAEADPDVLEEDLAEFFDVPVKRQRTSGAVGRPRSDKKSKKAAKPNRIKLMSKGTDSENEWVPEAGYVEKLNKRKKDQIFTNKTKDDLPVAKKAKLLKLGDSTLKKIRKGDFLHVSINQPGNGVPWTSLEDQAILVLQQDFGPNWDLLSNILNAGCHLKGHYRSPKDCKERHVLLAESIGSSGDNQGYSGILKGTSMIMLQKMQGPMEEDMVKYHLEQIVEAKKRHSQTLKDSPHEILQPLHESFYEVQRTHGRYLSPLDFADQPVIQKTDQVPLVNATPITGSTEAKPGLLPRLNSEEKPGETHLPQKTIKKPVQRPTLEEKDKPGAGLQVKQEPVHRAAAETLKAEHQHRLQQFQALSQKQRSWEQKDHQLQSHQRLSAGASSAGASIPDSRLAGGGIQQQVSGANTSVCRPNFQAKKSSPVATPLPPCSTSQQHHEPPSFPDHHPPAAPAPPQLQNSYRIPQQGSGVDPRMMIQQQQQQNPGSFHFNHRCFPAAGPRYSPAAAAQWRPGGSSPGMYNQMACLGNQVSPGDAAAFQQARFQSPAAAPRSMKQQQQMQRAAAVQQQQQQHAAAAAHHYLSPAGGTVRYAYPAAQPGFHHPVYNNGKAWQQQTQGNGGGAMAAAAAAAAAPPPPAERSCLAGDAAGGLDSSAAAAAAAAAPPSSCK